MLADTRDPPCADEYDPGKVWQVLLAGGAGWVRLAGRPGWPMGETHPYQTGPGSLLRGAIPAGDSHLKGDCHLGFRRRSIARSTPRGFGGGVA